jgi:hypothetical protein
MTLLMFHVRHNARPTLVREVLSIIADHESLTLDDILRIGAEKGCQIGTTMRSKQSLKENPIQAARDLALIEPERLALTDLGKNMLRLLHYKPNVWGEMLHTLFYCLWMPSHKAEHCFSWSYRTT